MRRLALILAVAAAMTAGSPEARAATTCTTDCAQTSCTVGCTEADVRDAVKKANDCKGNVAWTGRTIEVDTSAESPCTISMLNDFAMESAFPGTSCVNDFEKYAVCLTNDDIRFVGNGAVFIYAGPGFCGQCSGSCDPPQPALFTIQGNRNTVEDFTYRYFPEGIHIREGTGHSVIAVKSDRICEDAVTVDEEAGSGHVIRDSTFVGNQAPDSGRTCGLANGTNGLCGLDKAIQLNGGGSTIEENTIDLISQPVSVAGGTHTIRKNGSTGSTTDQNICQSYTAAGPSAVATIEDNALDHCKFGIRVDDGALVLAKGNTITNPWVSAFNVRGSGRLRGEANRVRTRPVGFTNVSDVQRGILVARNDSRARVDFGGGDFAGRSVVDNSLCGGGGGGTCSTGGNKFCSEGAGVQTDVWNITDCPCVNQFCGGALGLCSVHSCAPLDASGGCDGSGGAGASVGARNNCFLADTATDVLDPGAKTSMTGATTCSVAECNF